MCDIKILNKSELSSVLKISLPTLNSWIGKYEEFPVLEVGRNGAEWKFDLEKVLNFLEQKRSQELEIQKAKEDEQKRIIASNPALFEEMDSDKLAGLTSKEQIDALKVRQMMRQDAQQVGKLLVASDVKENLKFVFAKLGNETRAFFKRSLKDNGIPNEIIRHIMRDFNKLQLKMVSELQEELKIEKLSDDENLELQEELKIEKLSDDENLELTEEEDVS